jgi:hypothetical protein
MKTIKDEYIYDAYGNMTLGVESYWDETTSQNYFLQKSNYTYDVNGNITSVVHYNWDKNTSQWDAMSNLTYYYSELVPTSVPGISERNISVYPNPAREYIVFDLSNVSGSAIVELFDMEGKKVLDQKLPESRQISVSNLRKGLYLYRLSDRGNIYKGKIGVE